MLLKSWKQISWNIKNKKVKIQAQENLKIKSKIPSEVWFE